MPGDDRPPQPGGRVVRVVPAVTGVRKAFDYAVPAQLGDGVTVGTEVRVVLNNRRVGGWVVDEDVTPLPGVTLRPLSAVRGWGPPPAVVDLASWAAWRWAGALPTLLATASAPRAVRVLPAVPVTPVLHAPPPGAPVGPVAGAGDGRRAELTTELDQALSGGTVVLRLPPTGDVFGLVGAMAARLAAQSAADGAARSLLVLVPAHATVARLARRLRQWGHTVAELPDQWARARAGGCVAIGSRAAAFAPLPRIDAVVVLDAHDEAYVEQRAPTWCAWGVVSERARRDGAPCVLVSPCPTLELLDAGRMVTVSRRVERRGWPVIEVLDRTVDDPRTGLFSHRLVTVLRWANEKPGRRVACVVNRTGRVRLLACVACGQLARCEHCGATLELVDGPALSCRRCGQQRPVLCAHCGATRLKALRLGVTRVGEELAALTNAPVQEMWGPVTSKAGQEHVTVEAAPDAAVIVGTEAVLHRVARLDAVCFLDFDDELLAPRLHGAEEALALLARAARLVARSTFEDGGRDDRAAGRVLVQTRQPRHEVLRAAIMADPDVLAHSELEVRQLLGLPPVTALAVLSGAAADDCGRALAALAPVGVEVSGPVDGAWSVKAADHEALCNLLASVERPSGRLRVEVDPVRR